MAVCNRPRPPFCKGSSDGIEGDVRKGPVPWPGLAPASPGNPPTCRLGVNRCVCEPSSRERRVQHGGANAWVAGAKPWKSLFGAWARGEGDPPFPCAAGAAAGWGGGQRAGISGRPKELRIRHRTRGCLTRGAAEMRTFQEDFWAFFLATSERRARERDQRVVSPHRFSWFSIGRGDGTHTSRLGRDSVARNSIQMCAYTSSHLAACASACRGPSPRPGEARGPGARGAASVRSPKSWPRRGRRARAGATRVTPSPLDETRRDPRALTPSP